MFAAATTNWPPTLPLGIGWQLHSPSSRSPSDPTQPTVALASSPPKQQRQHTRYRLSPLPLPPRQFAITSPRSSQSSTPRPGPGHQLGPQRKTRPTRPSLNLRSVLRIGPGRPPTDDGTHPSREFSFVGPRADRALPARHATHTHRQRCGVFKRGVNNADSWLH